MGTPPAPLELPPDPFLGPDDPATVLVPALPHEHHAALTPTESAEVCEELEDIRLFQAILAPHGIRGIAESCNDCQDIHYFDWEILLAIYEQLLTEGSSQPHEPLLNADPTEYVTWDYCRGYCDHVRFQTPNPFRMC
ncbi:DUF5319 family protein [Lawsonella clevelandensis]|uniref:Uncharacterized protein n=1 Tax=Lawsonella clevelandensis TaxID=1528099 RepID=A0A0M4MX61_9ACTN|nr:DUF5319 family protein [Lawsonella clevelandensis]ALE18731.1 hypothetical protein AL705_02555 [Lawsonella clevelandensis]ALE34417.1 hypothetical protein IY73_02565 [Lawsonella clevelandensis]MDU7193771.1 DUF5319 family protein [Lawsonella clevelandensis]VHO00160.1 hypothetical protein LC603019_00524 [Lawsonella clevelandensis]